MEVPYGYQRIRVTPVEKRPKEGRGSKKDRGRNRSGVYNLKYHLKESLTTQL